MKNQNNTKGWKRQVCRVILALAIIFSNQCFFTSRVWAANEEPKAEDEQSKTVRVGYVDAITYEEMREDGYKSGAGYEYLQKISYITGWEYEYVYGSFQECYDMLVNGEIDLFGNLTYTPERNKLFNFSTYPQGQEVYCMYTSDAHKELAEGDTDALNGSKIGVTAGSYQMRLLDSWLEGKNIEAEIVPYSGYTALMEALNQEEVELIVTPDLSIAYGCVPVVDIGTSEYYFGVAKNRTDLLAKLNQAQRELQRNEFDYNGALSRKYHSQTNSSMELTEAEKTWLQARENELTIGLLDHNLPYSSKAEDGSIEGIMSVLGDTMEQELGIHVKEICYSTSKELLDAMERNEVDAIGPVYGDLYLAEQHNYALTNAVISTTPVMLYKDEMVVDQSMIAVSEETLITEEVVKILFPKAQIYNCKDMEECLNAVADGKADGTIVSSVRLNTLRQYDAMKKLQFADLSIDSTVCLATTKDLHMAAAVLNKGIALASASLNGSILAQSSYVAPRITVSNFVKDNLVFVLNISGTVIVILIIMAYFLYRNGKKLDGALEEAKEANQAKSVFLRTVSHDIRTPMNAIIGLTQLARREKNQTTIQEYLGKIAISGDFLLGLINDILDMSKIESGELQLSPEPMEMDAFFQSIDTVIRPLMEQRHVHLECQMEDLPSCIVVDKLRFQQIFLNLLSNASKFTGENGTVLFRAESLPQKEQKAGIRFLVRDNGIGMSEEFLKHLYDPFSQEKSKLSSQTKGTGLGLAIVKNLVDAMDGTITVKSKLGEGTEFCVELYAPMAQAAAEVTTSVESEQSLQGVRILLVEDNEINRYMAKIILEEAGCVVTCAENGQAAVERFECAQINSFDVILMDVRMPVMDGLEATKAIRVLDRADAKRIPIIAMTGDAFAEERQRTLDAGMNAHLVKPIDSNVLYQTLMAQMNS